jgi:hypothetical protein
MGRGDLTTDAIAVAIDGLHAMQSALLLEELDWIVEYDHREAWKEDGACSMADWIAYRHGHAFGTARQRVRVAHALRELPAIRASFAEGRLSWDKLTLLTTVADADSDGLWALEAERVSVAQLTREPTSRAAAPAGATGRGA